MNGRIYDPILGRFLQADPFIQAPHNSQSYNRYSYVFNNPLKYIDPSGYSAWTRFRDKVLKPVAAIVVAYYTGQWAQGWAWISSYSAVAQGAIVGAAAGGAGGFVATGSLKGTLQGAFSGSVFGGIGGYFNGGALEGGFAHIGSHAAAGGIISDLQGGNFGHGFWSAGLTKAANVNGIVGTEQGLDMTALRVATAAVIGGTISKITGGKFANGATTAAFAQAFNGEQQAKRTESLRETPAQRALREAGDVEGYYKARAAAGDNYAAGALMVVQDQCSSLDACVMSLANFGLTGTAFINGVDVDMQDVRLKLMNAHASFVEADNLGVPGLLNPRQIAEYHHQVFNGLGLPNATFVGTPVTGTLWEADVWDGIWCKGCDSQ